MLKCTTITLIFLIYLHSLESSPYFPVKPPVQVEPNCSNIQRFDILYDSHGNQSVGKYAGPLLNSPDYDALQKFPKCLEYPPPTQTVLGQSIAPMSQVRAIAYASPVNALNFRELFETAYIRLDDLEVNYHDQYQARIDFKYLNIQQKKIYYIFFGNLNDIAIVLMNMITNALSQLSDNVKTILNIIGTKSFGSSSYVNFKSVLTAYAYSFIFFIPIDFFLMILISDKETNALIMMKSMGMRLNIYYIANYCWFYMIYLVYSAFILAIDYIVDFGLIYSEQGILLTLTTIIIWGNIMVLLAIFISQFTSSRQYAMYFCNLMIIFTTLFLATFQREILSDRNTSFIVKLCWNFFPLFALDSLIMILTGQLTQPDFVWYHADGTGMMHLFIILIFEAVVITLVIYLLNCSFYNMKIANKTSFSSLFRTTKSKTHYDQEISDALLDVRNLQKCYKGSAKVVDNLSFHIMKNECFSLLGPNGAGKSTIMAIICGLSEKTDGEIKLCNQEVDHNSYDLRLQIGYCPQFHPNWKKLTARDHLEIYAGLKGLSGKELDDQVCYWLNAINLDDAKNLLKPSGKFSGGMKRRLAIACAFIGNPSLVILDEPSCGLDPIFRSEVWDMVNNCKAQTSILLSTHLIEEVEKLSDRICLIDHGQLVLQGSLDEIKQEYCPYYLISVESSMQSSILLEYLEKVFHEVKMVSQSFTQYLFQIRKDSCTLSTIITSLCTMQANSDLKYWRIEEPNLDQVILDILRKSRATKIEDSANHITTN